MGGLGAKLGKGWCDVYPKRTPFYLCIFYICANFGENPLRNASVGVHADGDADWFYNLYYAITGCAVAPALCYAGTLKQFNSLDHSNRYKFMKLKKIQDGGGRHPENTEIAISRQQFDRSAQQLA